MQYSQDTDGQDIVSLVGDATGVNTTAGIKQITRACNRALKIIWSWIFEAYGGWQFDDSNNSDVPTATTALVASQAKYTLPLNAKTVRALEYKDENGTWHRLKAVTQEEINDWGSESEFYDTASQPLYYSVMHRLLKLYPAPNFSQTASLRLQFDRGVVVFASTDIQQQPGFDSEFHEAVADGASYYIAKDKSLQNVQLLQDNWQQWENKIKLFYNKRFYDEFPHEIKTEDYTRQLI